MNSDRKDHYYRKAKADGRISRAAFKLDEVQKRWKLIRPGDAVVELGAAPGGWTQSVAQWVGVQGVVVAVDLVPLQLRCAGAVHFIQGDFGAGVVIEQIRTQLGRPADILLSDAAPKTTGVHFSDATHSRELCEQALVVAAQVLRKGGTLFCKVFAGDEQELIGQVRQQFETMRRVKPAASRKHSKEFYLLGRGYKGP